MFDEISNAFLRTHSIDKTVEETGINEYKVRRVLLTLGLWESERSKEVKALMEQGFTKDQIADRLHLSIKGLESYMPYIRGAYFEKETGNAKDSRNYRDRKKNALDTQVKKQIYIPTNKEGDNVMYDSENLTNIKVYKLKLSLEMEDTELDVLRKYGKADEGITRTILIPSSMQLNRLNYAIQKCFGFQNSHLHHFVLSDDDFNRMTDNDLDKWKSLAGKVFRCCFTDGDNDDYYYLDDYDGSCSFKTWLKRKYQDTSIYHPHSESEEAIQKELQYVKIQEKYDDIKYSLLECGGDELLERLKVCDFFGLSNEFFYEYDYGDNWRIKIELLDEYENKDKGPESDIPGFYVMAVTEENKYKDSDPDGEGELKESVRKVMATLAPVCLEVDGLPVIEDVGGVSGFCDFLKGLHGEKNNHGYVKEDIEWARSQGWNGRLSKADKLL